MAGDHEADGIASDGTADRAGGAWAAGHSGHASVARDLSVGNRPNHIEHAPIPVGQSNQVERKVEPADGPVEVVAERCHRFAQEPV
jgi:hypothetical protein